jgi:hypothetical protein
MDEEWLKKHEFAVSESRRIALANVNSMGLQKTIFISNSLFEHLRFGPRKTATRRLKTLLDSHGEDLPYLVGIALHETHFSVWESAMYCRMMGSSPPLDTPEGYANHEGWSNTLYQNLANLEECAEQVSFRSGTPIKERVSAEVLLECIGLYWLSKASELNQMGDTLVAQDWVYEGMDALELLNGLQMWDAGIDHFKVAGLGELVNQSARSSLARIAANARHAESRSMKAEVFAWLDANMNQFQSMEAAAGAIAGKIVPVKFRTARDWITDWKKSHQGTENV